MSERSLIVVTGPTASGKTSLAIEVAKKFNLEIINADSVQVYQDFNIGAAKPEKDQLLEVKHHLLSFVSPQTNYDAASFIKAAQEKILSLGDCVITGGTGLYIRSLLHGLVTTEKINIEAEESLKQKEIEFGLKDLSQKLYSWLKEIDSHTAESLKSNDLQRIRRALLVKLSTGKSLKELQENHSYQNNNYRALVICLLPEREQLYQNINLRVQEMLASGLIEEVRILKEKYSSTVKPFKSIGYKQVLAHLSGELNYQEMLQSIQQETRNFAKRQYTWWRNEPAKLSWQEIQLKNALIKPSNQLLPKSEIFDIISRYLSQETTYCDNLVWFLPVNFVLNTLQ